MIIKKGNAAGNGMSARILHHLGNPVINYAHRNYRSGSDTHAHKLSQSNRVPVSVI